jgi:hypothetical protein
MHKNIFKFFDKLEDKTRARLSRTPLLYAFIGGVGVVLFWRGVWHIADEVSISSYGSIIIGSVILLITGAFVSTFIGNRLIISGLNGEKKLAEKTVDEVKSEEDEIESIRKTLLRVEQKVDEIESKID